MFSCSQVETILEKATGLVKKTWRSWVPVSKARNHVQSKAREAFEEAAYRSKIRPSHVKCPLKRQTVKTHWFTRVANQDFEVSTGVKRSMRALYNKLTKAILECERKYKELKARKK